MIINHKNKFVFVGVSKTGSTTIHNYFGSSVPEDHKSFTKWHYPVSKIIEDHPEVKDYFKFGFCRNPWDRMVSCWYDFSSPTSDHQGWNKPLRESFSSFEDFILNFGNTKWKNEIRFQSCTNYLYYENKPIDYIGKFEKFNEEVTYILNTIGKQNISYYPLRNERKANRNKDYKQYYTNDMVDIVSDLFSDDITNFGYAYE